MRTNRSRVLKTALIAITKTGATVLLFALSQQVSASTSVFTFAPNDGSISFLAVGHPSAIKIHGEGSGPEGTLIAKEGAISGTLKFSIASLSTGIELRDRHMKEKYLESGKYPTAELKIAALQIPDDINVNGQTFIGTLTLKGIERPVSGKYSISTEGTKEKIIATFPMNLTDFKIGIPSYMGIRVAEDVTVEVKSTAEREGE